MSSQPPGGTLVRLADVAPQPWRNGGGVTRELLAWPPGADDWRVRVSVADVVHDGPFSPWPEVQRWFAVVEGQGVALGFGAEVERRVGPHDAPLAFDGAAAPACRLLGGPTRDLNLMLRGAHGVMARVEASQAWTPHAAMAGVFAAVAGTCDADGRAFDVPAQALLWFTLAPAALSFTPQVPAEGPAGWWLAATPEDVPS